MASRSILNDKLGMLTWMGKHFCGKQRLPFAGAEPEGQTRSDFSGGQRGRYAHLFPQKLGGAILSPDMAAIFPDSDAVNKVLRTLVKAVRGERVIISDDRCL